MKATKEHHQRIASLRFGDIYSCYLTKIEKKGRKKSELEEVISWLTGYDNEEIGQKREENPSFENFFAGATINPNAKFITGSICGYKVQEIDNELTKKVRMLDKLVDEIAKGKSIEKIIKK